LGLHLSYAQWLRDHGLDPHTGEMSDDGRALLADSSDAGETADASITPEV
jgi:hypothetical protein